MHPLGGSFGLPAHKSRIFGNFAFLEVTILRKPVIH